MFYLPILQVQHDYVNGRSRYSPSGERESNSPLLGICYIQNIIIGCFGELQLASTPKSSFALEGDAFEVGWDGAMHNAWVCGETSPTGHAGRCGPSCNNLWPAPAVWCIAEHSSPRGAAGWGVPPGSGGGAGLCAFPRDSAQLSRTHPQALLERFLWIRKVFAPQLDGAIWCQYTGPHGYSLFLVSSMCQLLGGHKWHACSCSFNFLQDLLKKKIWKIQRKRPANHS